ncbi:MAG TPA: glutaredoxin family protein [Terriglobales bacterium]|nr:glutaredoxin family protein [Terriglobales bacterium]
MTQKKVVVFTQPGCPPCHALKAYLSERGIEFEDRDVSTDREAVEELVHKYNSRSTPTLVVGDEVLIGFDPDEIDQVLSK